MENKKVNRAQNPKHPVAYSRTSAYIPPNIQTLSKNHAVVCKIRAVVFMNQMVDYTTQSLVLTYFKVVNLFGSGIMSIFAAVL